MKILSIGNDVSVFDEKSKLAGRIGLLGQMVDKYTIVVPSRQRLRRDFGLSTTAYGTGGVCKAFRLLKLYFLIKRLIKQEKFDVLTVQDFYYLGLLGCLIKKKYAIGLEIQVHGQEKLAFLRKVIAGYVLGNADLIRTVSQRMKKKLVDDFKLPADKIKVIPIYIEKIQRNDALNKDEDKFIFLTVGRLVEVKNVGLQIKAIKAIAGEFPNLELLIVGDGPLKKYLADTISDLGLQGRVKLLGKKSAAELVDIYSQADCFLLTSDSEGWGLVVIEAAQVGLPIIMTDVGCAGEVIRDYESGLIIPKGNEEKLIEKMKELLLNKELRLKLSQGARAAVNQLPDLQETLSAYKNNWIAISKKYERD